MAANTELSIPTLDIAPYVAWRASLNPGDDDATPPPAAAAVVAAWRDAYATYGFSQVVVSKNWRARPWACRPTAAAPSLGPRTTPWSTSPSATAGTRRSATSSTD